MHEKEILIVDDEPAIRLSLSQILLSLGYDVRCAADGFLALIEFRQRVPHILLSDLEMPGMSGFELLSVVRRRFPSTHVIAMSGNFSPEAMPAGVAADAFHQKGSSLGHLLELVHAMAELEREPRKHHADSPMPVWVASNGHNSTGEAYVTIVCPECLRAFPHAVPAAGDFEETACLHCAMRLEFAVDQATQPIVSRKLSCEVKRMD
jgi:CheY-like chemotaxis protein